MCVGMGAAGIVGSNISERLYRFSLSKLPSTTLTPQMFCRPPSAPAGHPPHRVSAPTYLIDFDHDQAIIPLQIDFVARPDDGRDELDDAVAIQDVMVSQGRPDGELSRQCQSSGHAASRMQPLHRL